MVARRLIFSLLLLSSAAQGQNACIPITRSGNYYTASATNVVEAEARTGAKSLLIEQISATISSRTDLSVNETSRIQQSSFYSLTKSVSQLYMSGIQYLTCARDKREGITVMAYISKDDLAKSKDEVSRKTGEYLELMEDKKSLGVDYLPEAYAAYLHTFLTPYPIAFSSGTTKTNDVRTYLETFFISNLSKIKLTCTGVEVNKEFPDQLVLALKVEGVAPSAMKFVFDCPELNARCEIVDMKGGLNVLMDPASSTHTFKGTLTIRPMSLSNDVAEVDRVVTLSREAEVSANMMSVIFIDFSIVDKGEEVQLIPETKHLSIRKFDWTSQGRTLSVDQRPIILRKEIGPEITLTINGNSDLSITRKTDGTGSSFTKKIEEINSIKTVAPVEDPIPVSNSIADKFKPVDSFTQLQQMLSTYKKEGKIAYGKKEDFVNPSNCWIFLVDRDTKKVVHLLAPESKAARSDVKSGKAFNDFETQLKGLVSIWAEFY